MTKPIFMNMNTYLKYFFLVRVAFFANILFINSSINPPTSTVDVYKSIRYSFFFLLKKFWQTCFNLHQILYPFMFTLYSNLIKKREQITWIVDITPGHLLKLVFCPIICNTLKRKTPILRSVSLESSLLFQQQGSDQRLWQT